MGFPSICYSIILPNPLLTVIIFFHDIKLVLSMAFAYLGLSSPLEDQDYSLSVSELDYFSPFSSHSIESSSLIKRRLPVLDYASFTKGLSARAEVDAQCTICLGRFETRDEVRELGNCCHAFHKGCIDQWIDKGHVNCPLCRASLWPEDREAILAS